MHRDADNLIQHLENRLGDQLRFVFEYDMGEDIDIHYLRSDLDRATFEGRARRMVDSYTHEVSAIRTADDPGLNSLSGSIHVFQTALVANLPDPSGAGGIAFSFDPGTGRSFLDFLSDCAAQTYGDGDHLPRPG